MRNYCDIDGFYNTPGTPGGIRFSDKGGNFWIGKQVDI